jgi:peroxiredoxin/predicted 2-oxoglutarate/Fe(II)-dependent dioxygenase YbiX
MSDSQPKPRSYANLQSGDPAPWFHTRTASNPNYAFDTAAGRYIVMCFFLTATDLVSRQALKSANAHAKLFDDKRFCFFGISIDPRDESEKRVEDSFPGYRYLFDTTGDVCRLYGASPRDSKPGDTNVPARRFWLVLDPTMRVLKQVEFGKETSNAEAFFSYLAKLPPPALYAGIELQAPVLLLPNVFEPEFCKHLIGLYEKHGGEESGFMREVNGKTMLLTDPKHKRRKDYIIEDEALMNQTRERVRRRIAPEIKKVHQFLVTRMERYIVSCYAAEDQAHFGAHRDNTTKGTAHRRFAVSINLNAEFEGGQISFPEYGPRSFKPPPGGACVFSCSLLHAVSEVTAGRRFAFLPFLYDDEAAKVREANNQFLGDGVGPYKQG